MWSSSKFLLERERVPSRSTAMGCAFGKQKVSKEDLKSPKEKNNKVAPPAAVVVSTVAAAASALEKKKQQQQLEPVVVVLEKEKGRVVKVRSKHNSNNGTSHAVLEEARERRRERREQGEARHNRSSNVPRNNLEGGEQVAAGWPAWLSAVAGDAIKGWIPRHAASFEKLDKVSKFALEKKWVSKSFSLEENGVFKGEERALASASPRE